VIKSMTGFAAVTREDVHASVAVTVRTVNHRHLDVQIRSPQSLAPMESAIRALVQRRVARGRVDMAIAVQPRRPAAVEVQLNEPFADALASALDRARGRGLISGALTPGDLLRFPQALSIRESLAEIDLAAADGFGEAVSDLVDEALRELDAMRVREGDYLRADLEARTAALGDLVTRVETQSALAEAAIREKLARRISELRLDAGTEPAVLAQEIVRFVARSDISEEIVRFRAHLEHWDALARSPEPCGRKLEFLLQEMNREVNTMGAKAEGTAVPELIVTAKAELEKLREQVQNVE
jgi:uncharacterized protein (TIGR00255 family)